ncbi:MAG: O-methyltransferase [Mycobacteriales bacterium]
MARGTAGNGTGESAASEHAEGFPAEDEILQAARTRAAELGTTAISPATGSLLRVLATLVAARAVVEIGTGAGVSGLWLLRGMRPDGVLTTVDTAGASQRAARQAFSEAGIASTRVRLINGSAHEVLPRLTDAAYDMVFASGPVTEYDAYLTEASRLLHPGGVLVLSGILADGGLTDPAAEEADTQALRQLVDTVRAREDLVPTLLTTGTGLLAAVYRPA